MRELIYVPIVHPAPQKILDLVDSERRRELEQIAMELAPYYDRITEQLSAINRKKRIHKVYVDSLDITSRLGIVGSGKGLPYIPVRMLCQEGAELMTTEDNFLLMAHGALQEFLAQNPGCTEVFGRDHKYPVAVAYDVLSRRFKDNPNHLKRVERMLTGKRVLDIVALRDSYIAWNIDYTLNDDENGALIIGRQHKVDKILRKKERPIKITYIKIFPHDMGLKGENEMPF